MPTVRSPLLNQSQIACATLLDTIPPCKPGPITIENLVCGQCDSLNGLSEIYNTLTWQRYASDTCRREPLRFEISYAAQIGDPFQVIAETFDTFYVHRNNNSLAGCYRVRAFDLSGNTSTVVELCNDNCVELNLPNIITPNGDNLNEIFRPLCVTKSFLQSFDCQIYNRWGKKVYQTDNPEILWGPVHERSTFKADPGTYYYVIHARFIRLRKEDEKQTLRGWVQVFKD
jgi:gliding motility-associated-like protein